MAWSWHLPADTSEHADKLQLTNTERTVLARVKYECDLHGPQTMIEVLGNGNWNGMKPEQQEAYQSLCRMGYIMQAQPRVVRHAATADWLSPAGEIRFTTIKARRYVCCDYTIAYPCVCSESTGCPHPDHHGGCHGTHD